MNTAISKTAEYGEFVTGPRIVTEETRAEMKRVLDEIQSGKFARDFLAEPAAELPFQRKMRERDARHPIEEVGRKMRALMQWLSKAN